MGIIKPFTSLIMLLTFFDFAWAGSKILSREEALALMIKNSPRWQQTQILSEEAAQQTNMAEAAKGPHIHLSSREIVAKINQLQYGLETTGPLNYISFGNTGFSMLYDLYDPSSNSRIDLAKKNEEVTSAQKEQYQTDLTFLLLAQYLQIGRLNQKIKNLELNIQRDEEIVKAAEMKVKVGAGIKLDQVRAKNLLEYDKIKRIDLQNQLEKAKTEMAQTLGMKDSDFDVHDLKFSGWPEEFPLQIERRKDLLAAQKTIELAQQNKNYQSQEKAPKLIFISEAGLSGLHVIGSNSVLTGSVGLQFSIPIYDSGLAKAKVAEAEAKVIKAELQKKNVEFEAESQVQMGLSQLKNANKTFELSEKQLKAAEEEMDIAKKRFQIGSSSGLEIANAQSSLANAQDLKTDALFGYEFSKLNYFKNLGRIDEYLKNGSQND